ncbi:MAG: hypothetical protein Q4C13_00190, partial [Clostridia bacterium]|nr:hypothetical protein [Clostridia bacterium]
YADFLVRGERLPDGGERIRIHTLEEACRAVAGKLSDMQSAKRLRYSRVTHKLGDFEAYLRAAGVNPDPDGGALPAGEAGDPALAGCGEAVERLTRSAIAHSLSFMHDVNAGEAFARMIEDARGERSGERLMSYLALLDEYCAYMPHRQRLRTLDFLYELLMHPAGNIRREAGLLMGKMLAGSGRSYRKELPKGVPETAVAPALLEPADAGFALFQAQLDKLLFPDRRIEKKHCVRIRNSIKVVADSLFAACRDMDARGYLSVFLACFDPERGAEPFALFDSLPHIPAALFTAGELDMLAERAVPLLAGGDAAEQIAALTALMALAENRPEDMRAPAERALGTLRAQPDSAAAYLGGRLRRLLGLAAAPERTLGGREVSELYLMDLKSAVHWMVKLVNIERLTEHAVACESDAFHVSTHLSNLLLVSEHLPVRERAGRALMRLAPRLSVDQRNELVIDLSRGLETLEPEFARYIPPSLGELCAGLPALEQAETIDQLERLLRAGSVRAACAALMALGQILIRADFDREESDRPARQRSERLLRLLLTGLAHYDEAVHRAALSVLCRDVFASDRLSLVRRRSLFMRIAKKLYTLLAEREAAGVTRLHTAAMLNHLYRLIVDCRVVFGPFRFPPPGAAAFFPGTFDPFSDGHKRIVTEIAALGMEVFLSIDDFSWSKRTQPKLFRRRMAEMAVADCPEVFLFPDAIPVNLANPADLRRLREVFPDRQIFIVAGSDVIENASAYADADLPGAANGFDHILFSRSRLEEAARDRRPDRRRRITGQVIELSLPTYYEDVSSSRIRESIDKNLEISMFVDPLVEAYIYERGLYVRTPQYKETARTLALTVRHTESRGLLRARASDRAEIRARSLNASSLFKELQDTALADCVRERTSGRILLIEDASWPEGGGESAPLLLGELLTRSLSGDHSYALYCAREGDGAFTEMLRDAGFLPFGEGGRQVWLADMRAPLVLTLDLLECIKTPLASDPEVVGAVLGARTRLKRALCGLFPGTLLLSFDTRRINHLLNERVRAENGVSGCADPSVRGPYMCVPYGKIMSDVVVPNTVTKTLHAEKVFTPDIKDFTIEETPGYAPLPNQVRAIRSFMRPVLLVDDLLHNGYRMEKLDPLFNAEGVEVKKLIVGVLSGRGQDLMDRQGREVEAAYRVPNLRLWFTESLLYPFLGGDGVRRETQAGGALPSINLILPYKAPSYIHGCREGADWALSMTALENARAILRALERRHQALHRRALTLGRLGEALLEPRMPDRGRHVRYDRAVAASAYLDDDIDWMKRMTGDRDAILHEG